MSEDPKRRGLRLVGLPGSLGGDPHDLALPAEALRLLRAADDGHGAPEPFELPTCGERLVADATPSSSRALAKLALDASPDVGDAAVTWLLGPWAELLDVRRPAHRYAWISAVAASAFALATDLERSPFRSWCRDDPRPREHERRDVIAVHRAPFAPWRLVAPEGDGWRVVCALPLGPGMVPDVPVSLAEAGFVDEGPRPGAILFARLSPVIGGGWTAFSPLVVPGEVSNAALRGWLARVAWPLLQENPEFRLEDVLRRAGHHMVALAHRAAWLADTERRNVRA